MTVYLVGAGPGDPGLLTRRGAEVLGTAEVVVFDRLVSAAALALAPPTAVFLDVGKRPGEQHRQEEIHALLVEHGADRRVVRLKGGDPFVFGRGSEEVEALRSAGIAYEVVPGVSSALAVPAAAGVPVTHRGLSSSVTVVTGHVGDPSSPGAVAWEALGGIGGTLVILMGMENRAEIARRLMTGGRSPQTPVAVIQWGTTAAQRSARVTLDGLHAVDLGPPATIVVGAVAGLDLRGSRSGPLSGLSVVVTRPRAQAQKLMEALSRAGAEVIALPVIAVADPVDAAALTAAVDTVGSYEWIVFTSVNAVERVVGRLRDGRALAGVKLAAVGPATAAALARRHLVADLVPAVSTADGLVQAMAAAGEGPGRRVLYPRAVGAGTALAEGLAAKGWTVDEVDAYRTVPATADDGVTADALAAAAAASVVTFGSPSAVEAYLALSGGLAAPVVACLGPVTAAAARRAGLDVAVVAPEASDEALVTALVRHRGGEG